MDKTEGRDTQLAIVIGKFNTPFLMMGTTTRQKISKDTQSNIINQVDLSGIYRTLHMIMTEYTIFSGTQATLSRIDDMLSHKTSFNKCKITEITESTFLDHNENK